MNTALQYLPSASQPALPRHVAVIGAAGGLGQGFLNVCRDENIRFTAIVRSRPERITDLPAGCRVVVVPSLSDETALVEAFEGVDAVVTAIGVTPTSGDKSAFLSTNLHHIEAAMNEAGVDRIIIVNTLIAGVPSEAPNWAMRFFAFLPGRFGVGAREMQAVVSALGAGALSSIRWTLVRASVNARGKSQLPVASMSRAEVSMTSPLSYKSMARWMLETAANGDFVGGAPLVSGAAG
jgi:putative NADH-flavin reductase